MKKYFLQSLILTIPLVFSLFALPVSAYEGISPTAIAAKAGAKKTVVDPSKASNVRFKVYIDGKRTRLPGGMLVYEDRTFVAFDDFALLTGQSVQKSIYWDKYHNIGVIRSKQCAIEVFDGADSFVVDGQTKVLFDNTGAQVAASAFVYGTPGKLYIPLQPAANALGINIQWVGEGSSIVISTDGSDVIVPEEAKINDSANVLLKAVQDKTQKKVPKYIYEDFDADGLNEMFAFVGENTTGSCKGDIYFSGRSGVSLLKNVYSNWEPVEKSLKMLGFNNKKMVTFLSWGGDKTGKSTLWSVENGTAKEILNVNGELIKSGSTLIAAGVRDEDAQYKNATVTGLSDPKFYFFYEDGQLREYGATLITKDQFLKQKGAEDVLGYIEKNGGDVQEILYRDNGIIHININIKPNDNSSVYQRKNLMVYYNVGGVFIQPLQEVYDGSGFVKKNVSDRAVFPDYPY